MNFNSGVVRDGYCRPTDESAEDMDYIPLQPAHEPDYDRLDTSPVALPDDDEEDEEGYWCPWCGKDNQTTEQIRVCSGYKPSGMPPNETGHPYGCGCSECMAEYQSLK